MRVKKKNCSTLIKLRNHEKLFHNNVCDGNVKNKNFSRMIFPLLKINKLKVQQTYSDIRCIQCVYIFGSYKLGEHGS